MSSEVFFVPVREGADQVLLEKLGDDIWSEYWPALIGEAQTRYMIDNWCSLEAIEAQMANEEYQYWFACVPQGQSNSAYQTEDGFPIVGYTGGCPEYDANKWFISKVYLLKDERGKHYSSRMLDLHEQVCRERGFEAMHLHVKRTNDPAVRAYKARGLAIIEEITADIGNGYTLWDYDMEKQIL